MITSLNTDIDVHLTVTPSLIINLIGFLSGCFYLILNTEYIFCSNELAQLPASSEGCFLDLLQKFTTDGLRRYSQCWGEKREKTKEKTN